MEKFSRQGWTSQEVARLIGVFESDRRFHDELVTTLPIAVATVGADGGLLSANHAFMREFDVQRDDLERHSLKAIFGDTPWQEALMPFEPGALELDRFKVVFTPIRRWEQGETEWSVAFLPQAGPSEPDRAAPHPATAELAANASAIEAAQRLAGRVTHEANNLVMIASGYGAEILSQLPADSPLREDVSQLLSATGRIEAMAALLGEFSRVRRGELAAHPLKELLSAAGCRIAGPPAEDVPVLTDRAALNGVFTALSLLAPDGLTVETTITAQEAVLAVKGFGMSAKELRQQLEALTKAALEGQKGARECALIGPALLQAGAGWRTAEPSTFFLHLPLAAKTSAPAPQRALVVDDQPGIRAIVRRILEGGGFQVADAGTGEAALSELDRRQEPFHLLITDMRMPGMTGRELASRVRERHPSTRILFISGFTDDPNLQAGVLPEGALFLPKPFHPAQLMAAVNELMERK